MLELDYQTYLSSSHETWLRLGKQLKALTLNKIRSTFRPGLRHRTLLFPQLSKLALSFHMFDEASYEDILHTSPNIEELRIIAPGQNPSIISSQLLASVVPRVRKLVWFCTERGEEIIGER